MSTFENAFTDKGMWPHTEEAISWVDAVFEPHFILFLDDVIRRRQELIASDYLQMSLAHVHAMYKGKSDGILGRLAYLDLVQCYHVGSKRKLATEDNWLELERRFLELASVTPIVAFYRLNYAFLCCRNGNGEHEILDGHYNAAITAAKGLDDTERYEALGHLHYNWARYLLKSDQRNLALAPWQEESSKHRITYYEALKSARAGEAMLLAAAQQIAKNLYEFRHFFPEVDTALCGVPQELFDSLYQTFGAKLLSNCVNKPKE